VLPEAVLAPLVGFDRQCYRLGNGGGYFDRTLAALAPRPMAIGVGFEFSLIETIHPQSFDIPMDLVVTEVELRHRPVAPLC
jgi:5-formyltetrahydrofolate cyclo-ligase